MVFIIVPAYNEEEAIGRVVRDLFQQGFQNVVVIDDGSIDETGALARSAGATVLRHSINRGQGAALQTGNQYALESGAEIVVHFDGDGQLNAKDIALAINRLNTEKLDIILGSRFLDSRTHMPWSKRHILLPISRWINFVFTGLQLSDVHNGFRILSRSALKAIVITQDGMAHNTEIVAQIKIHNLTFAEHPVEVRYYEYGQGVRGGLKILSDFLFGHFVN